MLNAIDTEPQVKEPDFREITEAEQNEQLMRNLCSDETRSLI